jgi:predicted DCC family thiol-disulfide oxidoreductase YuxK
MDGECSLCQKSRAWTETRDWDGRLRFIDFRAGTRDELPLTREDHETSMWVRDREGVLLEGFDAWRRIMAEIPGWRWLARLASLPPFTLIGPPLYRLIAANRRHFSR